MVCLAQSCSKYSCGGEGKIRRAIDAEAIAPYVTITIKGSEDKITVGNNSSPTFDNSAVISSFQYGQSGAGGSGCTIEIVDEEGGVFELFFNKLVSQMGQAEQKYEIQAKWGWVGSRCGDTGGSIIGPSSKTHTFLLNQVDIKHDGAFKFVLTGVDMFQFSLDSTKNELPQGSDDNPIKLRAAIEQLFKENNPPIKNVRYVRRTESGGIGTWDWKDKPRGVFHGNQHHVIGSLREWIRGYTTENDKGVTIGFDDTQGEPTVLLWEDSNPRCGELRDCGEGSLGTYIVNGGDCSPVIEFSPTIKWNFSVASNIGGFSDPNSAENIKQQDDDECNFGDKGKNGQGAGAATTNVIPNHHYRTYGKSAAQQFKINDKRNYRANANYESITAELRIQGDPSLDDPIQLTNAPISIVFINPFHLDGGDCPNWMPSGGALAASSCHQILSNKTWRAMGVSHEIRLGSYTTTLKVQLAAPGSTLNAGQPLGGNPEGYRMEN